MKDINILIGLSKALEKGTKIDEAMEKILEAIDTDPEAGMYAAYINDVDDETYSKWGEEWEESHKSNN